MKKSFRLQSTLILAAMLMMLLLLTGCTTVDIPSEGDTPLAAVGDASETATGEIMQNNEDGKETSGEINEDMLPSQIEIAVSREGNLETFIGTLAISSRFGYAIYTLDDYELLEIDGCDLIAPKADSPVSPTICMQIYEANMNEPIRDEEFADDEYWGQIISLYERVTLGDKVIEVQFNYPLEASGGGAVVLRAMADTIKSAKIVGK
jgi:hypothetical protein